MDSPLTRVAGSALALGISYMIQFQWTPGLPGAEGPAAERPAAAIAQVQERMAKGQYAQALEPASELHRAHPENHVYIQQLAGIDAHLGRFQEEAALWEQFLLYSPDPIQGCPQIGLAYRHQGLNDRAKDALIRCLQIEGNNPDVLYYLANTYEIMGDSVKAAETYRTGLAYAPNDSDLILGMSRIDLRSGKTAKAGQAAVKVLERFPDNSDALLVAGLAALREDRPDAARHYLEKGVRVSSSYVDIHLALGRLAESGDHRAEALGHYRDALRLDPANGAAKERVAKLSEARP